MWVLKKHSKTFLVAIATFEVIGIFFVFSSFAEDKIDSLQQANKICFQIDEIDIRDENILSKNILQQFKNDYEVKCLGQSEINNLLRELTNKYIESGFITTLPYIPEQNLNSKKLVIEIKKGKIEEIKYKSDRKFNQTHILPITEKTTLNLRDLEQSIDQFGNLKSDKTKIEIQPGREPGSSVVYLEDEVVRAFDFNTFLIDT
jgi:hemolysin activation/secretion protein